MEHRRDVVAAAAYIAAMLLYIYGFANPSVGYGSDAAGAAILVALALVHLATGLGGRWWLIALPLASVVLALPAGLPAKGYERFPIWFGLALYFTVPGAALIATGVAASKLPGLVRRRRAQG